MSLTSTYTNFCVMFFRKNLHLSEERIMYLKELSKKEAIYERLASALGMTSDDCNGRLEDL